MGVEAPNGEIVCFFGALFLGAVPKGGLVSALGDFDDLGGGNPKPFFGPEELNGEPGCFPGEACFGAAPNGEKGCLPGDPPNFFGGDPELFGDAADFVVPVFFDGGVPKLGIPAEFAFVGGGAPKLDEPEDDDCGVLFWNGFDDILEEGTPLFLAPCGISNLGESEDDVSGACGSNVFELLFGGAGVTFG